MPTSRRSSKKRILGFRVELEAAQAARMVHPCREENLVQLIVHFDEIPVALCAARRVRAVFARRVRPRVVAHQALRHVPAVLHVRP